MKTHETDCQEAITQASKGRLIPVTQWNRYHSWPPIGGLRYLIFNEMTNGFNQVVVRVGRRVLLDEDKFFIWARSGQGEKP